jgi:hypothetical protein
MSSEEDTGSHGRHRLILLAVSTSRVRPKPHLRRTGRRWDRAAGRAAWKEERYLLPIVRSQRMSASTASGRAARTALRTSENRLRAKMKMRTKSMDMAALDGVESIAAAVLTGSSLAE